jgi:hypothetical protein
MHASPCALKRSASVGAGAPLVVGVVYLLWYFARFRLDLAWQPYTVRGPMRLKTGCLIAYGIMEPRGRRSEVRLSCLLHPSAELKPLLPFGD